MDAVKEYEKFCKMNGQKPTNMKADYFIAGWYNGAQNAVIALMDMMRRGSISKMDTNKDVYERMIKAMEDKQ